MSSTSSNNTCSNTCSRMTARELIQYPEAKRVTKKTVEESLFPSLVDIELLRLDETCGVCLGDFSEDGILPSPSANAEAPKDPETAEPDVIELDETDEGESVVIEESCKDPLRDIGLLTGCTHTYHFFCIEKWGKQRENSCPQCKSRFSWIGRYSRSGRRICCCRVGLKNQKDTTEASIVDYLQLQQQQQQLCQVCNTIIETPREELRCSDQLCVNSFHFICAGFDTLPQRTWFCPSCRSSGICRDADSRRVPASRISPDGFLLPPRPRGRRSTAASGADGEQSHRDRDALVENVSNEVIRRINRSTRQQDGEEKRGVDDTPRRRSSRGRRETVATAATSRRGGRRQQQRQEQEQHHEETDEVSLCEPEGRASSLDIDYRRLGTAAAPGAASAAVPTGRALLVHPETVSSALGAPSDSSRMLRFYLRPESPVSATPRSNNSWLLQRKLDIIRLRQERREALRRQETLKKLEEQANVVCSGVSVENSSGAALVEDLLHHHDQLVRRHRGDQLSHRAIPVVSPPQSDSKAVADRSESAREGEHQEHGEEGLSNTMLERTERTRQKELASIDEGCTILATTCEELLREEAGRRSELSDDMIRAQILLDIDRARTKFCDEATKAVALKTHSNNTGRPITDRPSEAPCDSQRRKECPTSSGSTESVRGSTASSNHENRAGRHSMRTAEKKRRHVKIKPSQALVDRVKSFMMPFMLERYPNRGDDYRSEYKRICRHVSEGLTRSHEGPLLSMSEAERSQYWALNFVQVQTAVQDYFERPEEPLE